MVGYCSRCSGCSIAGGVFWRCSIVATANCRNLFFAVCRIIRNFVPKMGRFSLVFCSCLVRISLDVVQDFVVGRNAKNPNFVTLSLTQ